MRRRTLLRTAPLIAAPTLAGCAEVYGQIETGAGESHLHPAGDRYVEDGLTADGDDDFRAWLFTASPDENPIVGDDDVAASLRRGIAETGDDAFALLVEARMPSDEAFHLTPAADVDPAWTRLGGARLPFVRYVTDSVGFDAETAVATGLVRYEAGAPPRGATVTVYPLGADGDDATLARFDARDGG